jgi:hypothetical protein
LRLEILRDGHKVNASVTLGTAPHQNAS